MEGVATIEVRFHRRHPHGLAEGADHPGGAEVDRLLERGDVAQAAVVDFLRIKFQSTLGMPRFSTKLLGLVTCSRQNISSFRPTAGQSTLEPAGARPAR